MTNPLPTVPVHAIDPQPDARQWLVRDLWTTAAVGVIGGSPKVAKSWLGLDLAVSVASGTPALGRFPVDATGPAHLAEDALPRVRDRVSHLCRHRGLDLARLDLQVVTADRLRLDTERDQLALDQTVQRIRPALLLLDPLVRLHSLDENSASGQPDISSLLAFLRAIKIISLWFLVHHWPSAPGAISASCAAPPICMPTPPAISAPRRPSTHRRALPLRLRRRRASLALSYDAPPSPLPEAVRAALRSAGQPIRPSCEGNARSVSPSYLSNNAASPSAAPTAAPAVMIRTLLPTRSHPAAVPLFHRSAPGTRSERNDHRHTPRHLSCNQPRPGARIATAAPDAAPVIRGTGGIRKLRWAGSGRGKRGGIVFYQAGPDVIYLLTAYAKADREDLTPADSKALTRLVAAIKKELQGK